MQLFLFDLINQGNGRKLAPALLKTFDLLVVCQFLIHTLSILLKIVVQMPKNRAMHALFGDSLSSI